MHVDNEECSPLLAEYFRTKKMLDDAVEEEKPSQLVFEITNDDGLCVRARSCDGRAVQIVQFSTFIGICVTTGLMLFV